MSYKFNSKRYYHSRAGLSSGSDKRIFHGALPRYKLSLDRDRRAILCISDLTFGHLSSRFIFEVGMKDDACRSCERLY